MKEYVGSRGIAPLFLNLDTVWMPGCFTPLKEALCLLGGWMGFTAGQELWGSVVG